MWIKCPCALERKSVSHFCHVWLFVTPQTVARQAPLSMGFFQVRILEWVAISLSRGSSWPRDWTCDTHEKFEVGGDEMKLEGLRHCRMVRGCCPLPGWTDSYRWSRVWNFLAWVCRRPWWSSVCLRTLAALGLRFSLSLKGQRTLLG